MSSAMGCPHCRNVIQTAHAVPAGKQVKCPHCKNFFLAPQGVILPAAQVVAAPIAPVLPPNMPPPPAPVAGMPPLPPAERKKHKKDKKRRKHRHRHHGEARGSGKGLFKIVVGVLVVIVLLGLGAGASLLFSPGSGSTVVASTSEDEDTPEETRPKKGKKSTPKKETTATEKATETKKEEKSDDPPPAMKEPANPLVLVPGNSAVILGGNLKALAEVPAFKGMLAGPLAKLSADLKRDAGMELGEFAESAIVALHGSPANLSAAKTTLILKSAAPYDVKKLAASPAVADKAAVKGRTYYKLKADSGLAQGRKDAVLFTPSDRLLVLSDLPKADFEKLIGGELAKPALAAETVTLIGELQMQPVWAFVPLEDFRKDLHAGLMADKAPEELKPAAKALEDAKGLVLWAAPEGEATLLAAGLICADEETAKESLAGLAAFWKRLKDPAAMMAKLPPEIAKLATEFRTAAEFKQLASMVIGSVTVPVEPLLGVLASGEAGVKAAYPDLLAGLAPPPPLTLSKEEQAILDLTNKAREDAKLPALKVNPLLMKMAREHAANMAKQDKADDALDGKDHAARLTDAGYKIKEKMSQANLVSAPAAMLTPAVAVEAWLGDDASKTNILGKYTETGIAIAISPKKVAYYYQVFAVPDE